MSDLVDALVTVFSSIQDNQLKKTEKKAPDIPERLTETEKKLAEMFMQHTATSILDSGSAYGYNYQRSRENPEWEKPESYAEFGVYNWGLDVALWNSTYKLLSRQLNYNPEWDAQFQKWWPQFYERGESWEEHLEEFLDPETGDPCKETDNLSSGRDHWLSDYTYNSDNLLDRNIIYYKFNDFVIIQIHNGCDARGGFTNPVLFQINFYDDFNPYESASIRCSECNAYWDYDSCYCYASSEDTNLSEDYPCEKGDHGKVGVVVVTEEGKAYCPVCGKGVLE